MFKKEHSETVWSDISDMQKTFENKDAIWCILKLIETIIWTCRDKFEKKAHKWCILTLSERCFGHAEKIVKARTLNGTFWYYLKPMIDGSGSWTLEILVEIKKRENIETTVVNSINGKIKEKNSLKSEK